MEQRPLRLGDILDDYCPRERRVTNHAVVAMIEDNVKQTRCMTCDTEHAYKGGRSPARRKKETPAALYKDVLAGMPEADTAPVLTHAAATERPPTIEEEADVPEEHDAETPSAFAKEEDAREESETPPAALEDGPVHRPLIRATLPRPEGQKDARPLPEFTIRQPGTRANGNYRGGDPRTRLRSHGQGNGNRPQGGGRFGGPRPGSSGRGPGGPGGRAGQSAGFRTGQPRHGGRKRSR
jgi:hypothetical protein